MPTVTQSSVTSLWRYPVKSMQGEELGAAEVTARGLLGDRAYMLDSHAHLGITEQEWQVFMADFGACLDKFAVPKTEQGELFAIVEGTKPDIVRPASDRP